MLRDMKGVLEVGNFFNNTRKALTSGYFFLQIIGNLWPLTDWVWFSQIDSPLMTDPLPADQIQAIEDHLDHYN